MKLEREAKQSSEMVDRRENEASSNQMKADGREIDRTSGPFRAGFQKNLANQTSSLKTSLSRSAFLPVFHFSVFCCPAKANREKPNGLAANRQSHLHTRSRQLPAVGYYSGNYYAKRVPWPGPGLGGVRMPKWQ